jgi:nucleoid-associated protein YgaU
MTQYEKVGVLVITGLVAVVLALALFGTGTGRPLEGVAVAGLDDGGDQGWNPPGTGSEGPDAVAAVEEEPEGFLPVRSAPFHLIRDEHFARNEAGGASASGTSSPTSDITVEIAKGDSLYELAQRHLGSGARYREILAANPGIDAMKLREGTLVVIPTALRSTASRAEPLRSSPPRGGVETYVIQRGDTLSGIAKSRLGSASRWKAVFEANQDVLADPGRLKEGIQIVIPRP